MNTEYQHDHSSEKQKSVITSSRAPYLTSSGHVRYADKNQIKDLPIDFNAWVSVFEQDIHQSFYMTRMST